MGGHLRRRKAMLQVMSNMSYLEKLYLEKRTWRDSFDEGMRELDCDIVQGEHAMKWLDEELDLSTDVLQYQRSSVTREEETNKQIRRQ